MQERRKYSRKVVDLPATVRLSANDPGMHAKIIELSVNGAGLLCQDTPEVDTEMELHFSLPSLRSGHELRLGCKVRHVYKASDHSNVAGVEFTNIKSDEIATLEKFILMTH